MIKIFKYSVLFLALSVTSSLYAGSGHMATGDAHPGMMNNVNELMQDIGDHMVVISGDLSYGTLNLEQQRAMAEHVRNMATMLVELSGMSGKNDKQQEMQ